MREFTQAEVDEIMEQAWCKECKEKVVIQDDGSASCSCDSWKADEVSIVTGEPVSMPSCWVVPKKFKDLMEWIAKAEGKENGN